MNEPTAERKGSNAPPFFDIKLEHEVEEGERGIHSTSTTTTTTTSSSTSNTLSSFQAGRTITRPVWVKDDDCTECTGCKRPFTVFFRRHHCRGCGFIFCHECSDLFVLLPPSFGYEELERSCRDCSRKYSTLDPSKEFDLYSPNLSDNKPTLGFVSQEPEGSSPPSTEKPFLIFVHGAMLNRMMWTPQIKAFSSQYPLITVDLPAHGALSNKKLTMSNCLETIHNVITSQVPKDQKVILIGFEMGGLVSLMFAHEYPPLCQAVVAYSCVGPGEKFVFGPVSAVSSILPDKYISALVHKYSLIQREMIDECVFRPGFNYKVYPQCWDMMNNGGGYDFEAKIEMLNIPILFIHGEKEDRTNEIVFTNTARKGRLHIVKDSKFLMNMNPEFLDEFNEEVLAFVKSATSNPEAK